MRPFEKWHCVPFSFRHSWEAQSDTWICKRSSSDSWLSLTTAVGAMIVYAHASEEKCGSIGPLPPRGTRPAICCWPQLSHTPQAHIHAHMDTSFLTAIYPALPPNLCICMAPNHMSFLRSLSLALSAAFCRLSEWVQAPNISHGCLCSPDGLWKS